VPRDGKSSELKQIYVLASEYGTGLGRSLYEHAIDTVRAAGSAWVWLNVSDINYRAQAFYSKLGFQKLGVGPVFQVGSERLASSLLARKV
jgi:ribosomal protein S18 acetylase RimI-like enzyme